MYNSSVSQHAHPKSLMRLITRWVPIISKRNWSYPTPHFTYDVSKAQGLKSLQKSKIFPLSFMCKLGIILTRLTIQLLHSICRKNIVFTGIQASINMITNFLLWKCLNLIAFPLWKKKNLPRKWSDFRKSDSQGFS